jgi:hypothetical protein
VRFVVSLVVLVGCGFEAPVESTGTLRDAGPDSGEVPPDALPDAPVDAPPDALAACPRAPSGCTMFDCAGSLNCYYHCTNNRTWSQAEQRCRVADQLGCLVNIDSQAENDCIAGFVTPADNFIWIGYVQTDTSDEPLEGWTWACDGTSAYTPSPPWGAPQPDSEPNDHNGNEDCSAMITDTGHWNDAQCGDTNDYVCEFPR